MGEEKEHSAEVAELLKKLHSSRDGGPSFYSHRSEGTFSVKDVNLDIESEEDLEQLKELGDKLRELRKQAREKNIDMLRSMPFNERQKIIDKWVVETHPERDKLHYDPRFPNQNVTKRCWVNYIDMHRCLRDLNSQRTCAKYTRAANAICPQEWIDAWDEQLSNNLFPGIIIRRRSPDQVAKALKIDPKVMREYVEKHSE